METSSTRESLKSLASPSQPFRPLFLPSSWRSRFNGSSL
jgi:hypothetical protein